MFKLLICWCLIGSAFAVEEYEIWWEKCLGNNVSLDTFASWIGDIHAPSRVAMRKHVKKMGYRSLLDAASGLCTDYFGFKHDQIPITYQGVDITPKLVALAQKQHLAVIEGDIKHLPFKDSEFDISYARHILEHLFGYQKAVNELIRVAQFEVLVIFFMRPAETRSISSVYYEGYLLNDNVYDKNEIEKFCLANKKVSSISWEEVDGREVILHIYLANCPVGG